MLTSKLLQESKALIATPELWLKGSLNYKSLSPDGTSFSCFCTIGAFQEIVDRVSDNDLIWNLYHNDAGVALTEAGVHLGLKLVTEDGLAAYNDDPATTHADIMALYDKAIELQQKRYK